MLFALPIYNSNNVTDYNNFVKKYKNEILGTNIFIVNNEIQLLDKLNEKIGIGNNKPVEIKRFKKIELKNQFPGLKKFCNKIYPVYRNKPLIYFKDDYIIKSGKAFEIGEFGFHYICIFDSDVYSKKMKTVYRHKMYYIVNDNTNNLDVVIKEELSKIYDTKKKFVDQIFYAFVMVDKYLLGNYDYEFHEKDNKVVITHWDYLSIYIKSLYN